MLGSLDVQQVEENLHTAERRLSDTEKRIQRKENLTQMTKQGLNDVSSEISSIEEWINERLKLLKNQEPLGFESQPLQERQNQVKVIFSTI